MPRAYSTDPRERALAAYEGGEGSQSEVARRYRIGERTLSAWLRTAPEGGPRSPRPPRGGPPAAGRRAGGVGGGGAALVRGGEGPAPAPPPPPGGGGGWGGGGGRPPPPGPLSR